MLFGNLYIQLFVIFALFTVSAARVSAYDTETHSAIAFCAIHHHQLTVNRFLMDDLKWDGGIDRIVNSSIEKACSAPQPKPCTLTEWFRQGSVREDDYPRYKNHFYNPLKDKDNGLSVFPLNLNGAYMDSLRWMWNGGDEDSTQYIIGQEDARFAENGGYDLSPQKTPENLWSWKMARYYYFSSLVRSRSGLSNDFQNSEEGIYPKTRASAQAKTFYALGHIIHLVQDLAQPQHTRNDAHIHFDIFGHDSGDIGLTQGAPFENYCKRNYGTPEKIEPLARLEALPVFASDLLPKKPDNPKDSEKDSEKEPDALEDLPKELRFFWDTDQYKVEKVKDEKEKGKKNKEVGILKYNKNYSSLGLAEYSNAFFVTDDTLPYDDRLPNDTHAAIINKPSIQHQFPYPNYLNTNIAADNRNQYLIELEGQVGGGFEGKPKTCGIPVDYLLNNEYISNLFSYKSSVSPGNRRKITYRIFLCDANYEAQARKLIPKAVSYSAGVLEYFFRGRLQVNAVPIETTETQSDPQLGEDCWLTVANLTTTEESIKGIDYFDALSRMLLEMNREKLRAAAELTELGRKLRKESGSWYLLEDISGNSQTNGLFDRLIVLSDFFQSERNPQGFDGELKYNETFTVKARLQRGHTYTLVFRGTIGNETQSAIAAKTFVFE